MQKKEKGRRRGAAVVHSGFSGVDYIWRVKHLKYRDFDSCCAGIYSVPDMLSSACRKLYFICTSIHDMRPPWHAPAVVVAAV